MHEVKNRNYFLSWLKKSLYKYRPFEENCGNNEI